ncbi:hypothetical protein TNCV_2926201 [Trichonephila clavipes]|nr:hypothetical protein TNCV_2926201 [Trichonephila clavipes]
MYLNLQLMYSVNEAPPHWFLQVRKNSLGEMDGKRKSNIVAISISRHNAFGLLVKILKKYWSPICNSRITNELKSRIAAAIQKVDSAMFHRTWPEIS